jgi:glutaconate CoA-transferase subunit A
MTDSTVGSLSELVAEVRDGMLLAVPNDRCGVAMKATFALAARGVRDLHLVCVPVGGLQAEILIGAGAVATLETSAVTMGELGPAPRFVDAIRQRTLRIVDSTCPAVHAALQAGQKGIPFIPLRGLIGSDLLARRDDWKVIEDPFAPGERIALLKAIRPDVALFHAEFGDRHGNVFIGRERELLTMAQASHRTLVTVERLVDGDLLADDARAGSVVPAIYVTRVAVVPNGAWPVGLVDGPGHDEAELARYMAMARTPEGFRDYLAQRAGAVAEPA